MVYWLTGWEAQGISVDLQLHTNGGSINIPAENNVSIAQNAIAGDTIIITLNSTTFDKGLNESIIEQTSNITEGQVNIILYNISDKIYSDNLTINNVSSLIFDGEDGKNNYITAIQLNMSELLSLDLSFLNSMSLINEIICPKLNNLIFPTNKDSLTSIFITSVSSDLSINLNGYVNIVQININCPINSIDVSNILNLQLIVEAKNIIATNVGTLDLISSNATSIDTSSSNLIALHLTNGPSIIGDPILTNCVGFSISHMELELDFSQLPTIESGDLANCTLIDKNSNNIELTFINELGLSQHICGTKGITNLIIENDGTKDSIPMIYLNDFKQLYIINTSNITKIMCFGNYNLSTIYIGSDVNSAIPFNNVDDIISTLNPTNFLLHLNSLELSEKEYSNLFAFANPQVKNGKIIGTPTLSSNMEQDKIYSYIKLDQDLTLEMLYAISPVYGIIDSNGFDISILTSETINNMAIFGIFNLSESSKQYLINIIESANEIQDGFYLITDIPASEFDGIKTKSGHQIQVLNLEIGSKDGELTNTFEIYLVI